MRFYKFEEFKIDRAKRKFYCNGQEIDLRDRDFDVLLFLIENRSKVQPKDKIIKAVWEGTTVEDNSVERAIVNIRKVLGDDAANPWFIKTVRGKGYLFICDVEESDEEKLITKEFQNPVQTESKLGEKFPKWISSAAVASVLLIGFLGVLWWNSTEVLAYFTSKTVFSDDFSNKKISPEKWKTEGNSVRTSEGKVRISVDKLGRGGKIDSAFFSYNPEKPLTIKSRLRISYNKSLKEKILFIGAFGLAGAGATDNKLLGVKYSNAQVEFAREGKATLEGFYLVKDNADLLDEYSHCNGKIGPRTDAVWDEWFEQKLVYEPKTKTLKLFINGEKKGEFPVGKLPASDGDKLRLVVYPKGAFLHHAIEIDYVEITQ